MALLISNFTPTLPSDICNDWGENNIAFGYKSLGKTGESKFKYFNEFHTDRIYELINCRIKNGYTYERFTENLNLFIYKMKNKKNHIESMKTYDDVEVYNEKVTDWNNEISILSSLEYKLSRVDTDENRHTDGDILIKSLCDITDKFVKLGLI